MKHMFTHPIPKMFLAGLLLPLAIVTSPLVAQDSDLIVLDLYGLTKPSQTGSYGNIFVDLLLEHNKDPSNFVISKAFSKAYGFLFTAKNPSVLQGEKPILGTIGLGDQYGLDDDLYRVTNIKSYKKLLNLINNNRIDAAYITYPDVASYPDAMEEIDAFKGAKEEVWSGEDAIVCHQIYAEKIALINKTFQLWRESGHLKTLLGNYSFKQ